MKRPILISSIAILVLAGAMTLFANRVSIRDAIADARRPALPEARPYVPPAAQEAPSEAEEAELPPDDGEEEEIITPGVEGEAGDLSGAMNLSVPFTPQAPHADWSLPYQEACEEASLIMVNAWMVGAPSGLMEPDQADRLIRELVSWEEDRFGYYEDTTAEETALIAKEFYGYANTEVLPVTSMEDVKAQVSSGNAVILPAAGRELGNPYFSGEGPLYHMLVVKGFTDDGRIITNDPGTRRGEDFLYDPDVLFDAVGDWNGGRPEEGEKVMIVVKP